MSFLVFLISDKDQERLLYENIVHIVCETIAISFHERMTFTMICVTTRFRLKHFWQLIPMYLSYRSIQHDLDTIPGLIRYAFLFQSPIVCYTISVWESEKAIMTFSNLPSHISALRYAKRLCRDIWSAYWHINAVSKSANRWPGSVLWPSMTEHPTYPHLLVEKSLRKE
jgi:hypothetical protein